MFRQDTRHALSFTRHARCVSCSTHCQLLRLFNAESVQMVSIEPARWDPEIIKFSVRKMDVFIPKDTEFMSLGVLVKIGMKN